MNRDSKIAIVCELWVQGTSDDRIDGSSPTVAAAAVRMDSLPRDQPRGLGPRDCTAAFSCTILSTLLLPTAPTGAVEVRVLTAERLDQCHLGIEKFVPFCGSRLPAAHPRWRASARTGRATAKAFSRCDDSSGGGVGCPRRRGTHATGARTIKPNIAGSTFPLARCGIFSCSPKPSVCCRSTRHCLLSSSRCIARGNRSAGQENLPIQPGRGRVLFDDAGGSLAKRSG